MRGDSITGEDDSWVLLDWHVESIKESAKTKFKFSRPAVSRSLNKEYSFVAYLAP
jgi:hypothetical protein